MLRFPRHATFPSRHSKAAALRAVWARLLGLSAIVASLGSATAGELTLSWKDNSWNEDGFELERASLGESFGLLDTVEADVESYVDSSVVPGLQYEYRVRAYNAFGYSSYTNVTSGSVPNGTPSITDLADVSVLQGEDLPVLVFSYEDPETDVAELTVEAISSNLSFLPLDGIGINLENGVGTLTLAPGAQSSGSAIVTLLVSDGVAVAQETFRFEVLKNLAPTVGTLSAVDAYEGQRIGPVAFSISDGESAASELHVAAQSLNESLVSSESIVLSGAGSSRTVSFATNSGVSGSAIIRLMISDGVNQTSAALRVNVAKNGAPVISGLQSQYTIENGGRLDALAFSISDPETAASQLQISVRTSNSLLASPAGIRVKGTGSQRTLDVTPGIGLSGSVQITVSVSDGVRTTEHSFDLRVLASEQIVNILAFSVEQSLAVIEVENRENATFTLWKIHARDGVWIRVADAEIAIGAESASIIDPTPIESAVCYRVIASE